MKWNTWQEYRESLELPSKIFVYRLKLRRDHGSIYLILLLMLSSFGDACCTITNSTKNKKWSEAKKTKQIPLVWAFKEWLTICPGGLGFPLSSTWASHSLELRLWDAPDESLALARRISTSKHPVWGLRAWVMHVGLSTYVSMEC